MKHLIITKIYEVRYSAKGGSWTHCFFFQKDMAETEARLQNEALKLANERGRYRVIEHSTTDALIISGETFENNFAIQ